ncbi:glutathione S-transferase family protein [Glaciecola sp. MF2-115]|uniref:glutathione S-transferase family protein n=1 Tax=Glaciecola sp. MF2-115 TaxID=3384827 RepID=UPI00399F7E39
MANKYTLYGAQLSLYTGKLRSYLRYKQIPYEEVFSSRKVYKDIIIPKTGVQFIPVLKTPQDEYLQDTSAIMDVLELEFKERSVIPNTPKQKLISAILEMWGDECLLLAAMHYRWNHDNFPFIYEEFGEIALPNMPAFIRRFVGKKLGAKFKGFVPMLGITPNSIPAIEDWYEHHVLPILDKHFAKHEYLLGGRPSTGDFGLMGPLYAHLYRDPASGRLMKQIAPNVSKWVERMNQTSAACGEWLADDEIPDTLFALLKRQFVEFWPLQITTLARSQAWMKENPEKKKLPRMLGEHTIQIGDISEKCAVRSFSHWKLQRILDLYGSYSDSEKASVDPLLNELGGLEMMQTKVEQRVTRENNLLVKEGSN